MVCILTHGSRRGVRRKWQGQKPLIFMRFHGVSLGNQHKIWSKQHNGKVSLSQFRASDNLPPDRNRSLLEDLIGPILANPILEKLELNHCELSTGQCR